MPFRPKIGEEIQISGNRYRFTEHPSAKGMPYGQAGRRATVYQVQDQRGVLHALKVFTLAFRDPHTIEQAQQIAALQSIPGLKACHRYVLSPQIDTQLIQQQPDLKYAVLMPWVQGLSWQEVIMTRRALNPDACKTIAEGLIRLLSVMEQKGIAHCDLSGPNVLLEVNGQRGQIPVSLIDLEDIFGPGLSSPKKLPAGSFGYAHADTRNGIWSAEADRFAGAILIAEMLGWCDERVRRIAFGEQYFDAGEMQIASDRYQLLVQVIRERWGERPANAFTQAWFADSLKHCPSFAEWDRALNPPPDPDTLFAQLQRAERLGRWTEVLTLCDEVLKIDSGRVAVWPIRARAQRLQQIEAEIEAAWQKASSSGLTADWEACLKLINSAHLVAPQVVLYQAQREQAESELETALRLDEIEQQLQSGNWKGAQRNLFAISPIQPRFSALKVQVDQYAGLHAREEELRHQAVQAFQRKAWQETLDSLQSLERVQTLDAELAEMKQSAQTEQDREQKLHQSLDQVRETIQSGDYDTAHSLVAKILLDWPNNVDALKLKTEIEEVQTRLMALHSKLETVRKKAADDKLQEALDLLTGLPMDVLEARLLRETIQRRMKWRKELDLALQIWRMQEVLRLLDQRPPEEVDRPELRARAEKVVQIERELEIAREQADLEREASLLKQAPQDYPGRAARMGAIENELDIRRNLEPGLTAYDLDAVQRVFEHLDRQDARWQTLSNWIRVEKLRRQRIATIRQTANLADARSLISELPQDYPLREELAAWVEQEETLRKQIMEAVERYDLAEWSRLLASLPQNHPLESALRDRLEREQARADRIQQARALFDGHTILSELAQVEENYPAYRELSDWATAEIERQAAIRQALMAERVEEIEKALEILPADHPFTAELQIWLEHEHQRAGAAARAEEEEEDQRLASLAAAKAAAEGKERLARQAEKEKLGQLQAEEEGEEDLPDRSGGTPFVEIVETAEVTELTDPVEDVVEEQLAETAQVAVAEEPGAAVQAHPQRRKTWLGWLIGGLLLSGALLGGLALLGRLSFVSAGLLSSMAPTEMSGAAQISTETQGEAIATETMVTTVTSAQTPEPTATTVVQVSEKDGMETVYVPAFEDLDQLEKIAEYPIGEIDPQYGIDFSPSGNILYFNDQHLIDFRSGEVIHTFSDYTGWISVSPNDRYAYSESWKNEYESVLVYDLETHHLVKEVQGRWFGISENGARLAVVGWNNGKYQLDILDTNSTDQQTFWRGDHRIDEVSFSTDGTLLSVKENNQVHILTDQGAISTIDVGNYGSFEFSYDHSALAGTVQSGAKIWDIKNGEEIGRFIGDKNQARFSFSDQGPWIGIGIDLNSQPDRVSIIYDYANREVVCRVFGSFFQDNIPGTSDFSYVIVNDQFFIDASNACQVEMKFSRYGSLQPVSPGLAVVQSSTEDWKMWRWHFYNTDTWQEIDSIEFSSDYFLVIPPNQPYLIFLPIPELSDSGELNAIVYEVNNTSNE